MFITRWLLMTAFSAYQPVKRKQSWELIQNTGSERWL